MCQLVGWGIFILVNLFFAFTFDKFNPVFCGRLLVFAGMGFLFSHFMRYVIIKTNILSKRLTYQITFFIIITIVFALIVGYIDMLLTSFLSITTKNERRSPWYYNSLSNALSAAVYLFIWNCIYFIYHYIGKNRSQEVDMLKLEALVKEQELKTIKSHINPHFIFNALNSVRALIDENPGRAREAITALSSILRSSMRAEKQETVPFQKELKIVKDYLALENIRFEDRLKVEYDIDEETLMQPVPPMMLQTLVENAVKHGISKQVAGGVVRIISRFRDQCHELVIENTGRLDNTVNTDGFGLSGSRSRLQLLFGEKAGFSIREVNGSMVEVKIQLPLNTVSA
ncbi:MAG TPA: histidine kinase [Chitinophagaceae bacterium]|nr:histidine kinase [Chitinophagaceae bacterium]